MKEDKVIGELKVTKVVKPRDEYCTIVFRQNRTYDLHIGRDVYTFHGMESKRIPKHLLLHSDFLQASEYFVVKGV